MRDPEHQDRRIQIGQRIRRLREERGLLLEDMRALTGLSYSTQVNIELGKVAATVDSLYAIAEAFDVAPETLITGRTEAQMRYDLERRAAKRTGIGYSEQTDSGQQELPPEFTDNRWNRVIGQMHDRQVATWNQWLSVWDVTQKGMTWRVRKVREGIS